MAEETFNLKDKTRNYTEQLDYTTLNKREKQIVEEVVKIYNSRDGVPNNLVAEEVKTKFQLKDIPFMKIENTLFYTLLGNEKLGQSIQGWRTDKDEKGNNIRIPHLIFSGDLDVLEDIMKRLVTKIKNMK